MRRGVAVAQSAASASSTRASLLRPSPSQDRLRRRLIFAAFPDRKKSQSSRTAHRSHSGLGLQIRRPCRMSVSDVRVHSGGGIAAHSCCSTTSGSSDLRDADPIRDAQHVAIDRQTRHAKRVAEDDVRGLAADARQARRAPPWWPGSRRRGARRRRRHAHERPRLRAEEACRLNLRLELLGRRPRERAGVRVSLEERGRDLVDALVGALRGEDRRDEQLVRRREVQLGIGIRVLLCERRQYAANLRRRLRGLRHARARRGALRHAADCSAPPTCSMPAASVSDSTDA